MKNLKFLFAIALFFAVSVQSADAQSTPAIQKAAQPVSDTGEKQLKKAPKVNPQVKNKPVTAKSAAEDVKTKKAPSKVKTRKTTSKAVKKEQTKDAIYQNMDRIKRTEEYIKTAKAQLIADQKAGNVTPAKYSEKRQSIADAEKSLIMLKKSVEKGKQSLKEE